MGVLGEILSAETMPVGIAGVLLLHLLIWYIVFDYDSSIGLARAFRGAMQRTRRYHGTIARNCRKQEDFVKMYALEDEPGLFFVMWTLTCFHHATGGALLLAGMAGGRPSLVRHGLLVEAAGLDLLDFVKVAWCRILPPGPFPWGRVSTNPVVLAFTAAHHSVALTCVVPIMIYFSDDYALQEMAFVLLGLPFISLVPTLVGCAFVDTTSKGGKNLENVITMYGLLCLLHQRVWYFFPKGYAIVNQVYAAEGVPLAAKIPFFYSFLMMSLFNLAMTAGSIGNCLKIIAAPPDSKARKRARESIRVSVLDAMLPASMQAGILALARNEAVLYSGAKMVTLAHRARKRVQEKKERHRTGVDTKGD